MNDAEHDESIGSMLASIATALREVSDKLDIVAARVQQDVPTFPADEDLPDQTRIRQLESWAFHASQDISRLSSRLDALDGGEPDSGPPARGTRSRREVREAAEAAQRAADGIGLAAESSPPQQNHDADSSRPPLERRSSPARPPTTDHLGDPTALAATPIPRTAAAEAVTPFGQPRSFDSDSSAAIAGAGNPLSTPGRRPAPARLSGAAANGGTASASAERVTAASVGKATSTNGTAATNGVAGDIAAQRNGVPVPAVIGTVLTAPSDDHTSGTIGTSAPTSTATRPSAPSDDNTMRSAVHRNSVELSDDSVIQAVEWPVPHKFSSNGAGRETSAEIAARQTGDASVTLPGSADVGSVVREGDMTIGGGDGVGPSSGAERHGSPAEAEPRQTAADAGAPPTAGSGVGSGIERAQPVKKPMEGSAATGVQFGTTSPNGLSSNGNSAARFEQVDPTHAESGHQLSGFTTSDRTVTPTNGKSVNGFEPHSHTALNGESVASANAQSAGTTANGIHWSFTDDPAPTSPSERNGHARNDFTTGSARHADSIFDDFTPRDRLTTGAESPEPPSVSGPPPRLTPPAELTTPPNHAALTDHDRSADDFDPPTLGLPTGHGMSTTTPDPLEHPVSEPIPPTATDSAGLTVTGTFRAFDIERAHVDKLQAMLDELKRSAGLPPGRRDVFGPQTPELG